MHTFDSYGGRSLLIEDAALVLGVSRRTVYYRIRDGRLKTVRTRGGSQRVLMVSIRRLLRERDDARGAGRGATVASRGASLEAESLAFQVQALAGDAERLGGRIDLAVGRAQGDLDHLAFERGNRVVEAVGE